MICKVKLYRLPQTTWLQVVQGLALAPVQENELAAHRRRATYRAAIASVVAQLALRADMRRDVLSASIGFVECHSFAGLEPIFASLFSDPRIRASDSYRRAIRLWSALPTEVVSDCGGIFYNIVGERLSILSVEGIHSLRPGGQHSGVPTDASIGAGIEALATDIINGPLGVSSPVDGRTVVSSAAQQWIQSIRMATAIFEGDSTDCTPTLSDEAIGLAVFGFNIDREVGIDFDTDDALDHRHVETITLQDHPSGDLPRRDTTVVVNAEPQQPDRAVADTAMAEARQDHGCFVAGTRVMLADGTLQRIDMLAVGDYLFSPWAADDAVAVLAVCALTGRPTMVIHMENGELIEATGRHLFLKADPPTPVPAMKLQLGQKLMTNTTPLGIVNISEGPARTVYQVVVDQPGVMLIGNSGCYTPIRKS